MQFAVQFMFRWTKVNMKHTAGSNWNQLQGWQFLEGSKSHLRPCKSHAFVLGPEVVVTENIL